ncbi:MAG: OB-fold domain-containing protein [Solirubrobacterales bacterium]|nr:OB-fold domain-containing protein [Solirubrobacterales bacterium]MBV9311100.1 OB-fold domain-containing protein [Solirubrobacterales bacterium]
MTDTRISQLIDADVIGGTPEEPTLIGSVCAQCGTVTFPRQRSCPRCTSEDVQARELATRGELWTWTIQCFPPKAPPYLQGGVEEFEPYGVGYIELPGEVRVEARLTESDPERLRVGMTMELTLIPVPGASDRLTFAFRPVEENE